ncbi:hypothetical protein [Longivirga aurantiaca]|uniref:LpxI C-terminal domain-containing protein n=1 Tax=Longivirga aurantiaca TaxID=1837743 RepID=A0ABW1T0Z3_9ACTN
MSSLDGTERDLLRQMVRQVLLEVVPQTMAAASASASASDESVVLTNDAELEAFVRRVAVLCEDPAEREALRSGSRRFRLAGHPAPSTSAPAPAAAVVRVDKGAVTERHVREAAAAGADLVLGRGAVLTPLARDRARAAGVRITKEK